MIIMNILLYIIIIAAFVFASCIIYSLLWGADRSLVRTREYCYRNLQIPTISDDEFSKNELFLNKGIPKLYIIAKRYEIADEYLDFPIKKLDPNMVWNQIPLDSSFWGRSIRDFSYYIRHLGLSPHDLLNDKSIAQIIDEIYKCENILIDVDKNWLPGYWYDDLREIRRNIRKGLLPPDFLTRSSVAEVIEYIWNIRTKKNSINYFSDT